jgi:ubiquinone/menaquinone biosynthesis C-methylase UbiE
MEGMEYFYELFEALPRCGPGDNDSTRRAFNAIPELPKQPYILDIGCGPGVQTITLAEISHGTIIALDNHQAFLDQLMRTARDTGLEHRIIPKNISMLNMDFREHTFDLIWSEGALYFMGFQHGLGRCHQIVKKGGYVAVTELVYTSPNPPAPVIHYFEKEYPDIKDITGKIEVIHHEGFRLLSHFTLPESSWLDSYYLPMEAELSRLRDKYQGNEIALGIFEEMKYEIDFYTRYSNYYGYEFFIMQRADERTHNEIPG